MRRESLSCREWREAGDGPDARAECPRRFCVKCALMFTTVPHHSPLVSDRLLNSSTLPVWPCRRLRFQSVDIFIISFKKICLWTKEVPGQKWSLQTLSSESTEECC